MEDNALGMRFCQNGRIAPDNDTINFRSAELIPYVLLFPMPLYKDDDYNRGSD